MWKNFAAEPPPEHQLVLFRWRWQVSPQEDETICAGDMAYEDMHGTTTKFPVIVLGDTLFDGEDPIEWCEIPK